jgi:hypothetical protein
LTPAAKRRFASLCAVSLADARPAAEARLDSLSPLARLLRCLESHGEVRVAELTWPGRYPELGPDGRLECSDYGASYPVIGGTPRILQSPLGAELRRRYRSAQCALEDEARESGWERGARSLPLAA